MLNASFEKLLKDLDSERDERRKALYDSGIAEEETEMLDMQSQANKDISKINEWKLCIKEIREEMHEWGLINIDDLDESHETKPARQPLIDLNGLKHFGELLDRAEKFLHQARELRDFFNVGAESCLSDALEHFEERIAKIVRGVPADVEKTEVEEDRDYNKNYCACGEEIPKDDMYCAECDSLIDGFFGCGDDLEDTKDEEDDEDDEDGLEVPNKPVRVDSAKIGKHVRINMRGLSDNGYMFTRNEIIAMTNKERSKEIFGIDYPFMRDCKSEINIKDENAYNRYWEEIFEFGDDKFLICSQWFEHNRSKYNEWFDNLPIREPNIKKQISLLEW